MKGVFVVLDGVADDSLQIFKGQSPLEHAQTPFLDRLARASRIDSCTVVKEGVAPESSGAILSLLGYDSQSVARGPLEALGAGIRASRGDLVLRTNFSTIEDITSLRLLDRRAGRTLSTRDAKTLAHAINSHVKLPHPFTFYPTVQHRGIVVFKGGFSDNISNVDPHYGSGSVSGTGEVVPLSHSLDDDSESKVAANLVNMFVRRSFEILDVHPLNIARAKKGLFSANFLLCRDPGSEIPRLPKLKGSWMSLTYMPLEVGISRAAKMDVHTFAYPPLHGIDVYENLYSGLAQAVKEATRALSSHANHYDYFFVHFKETDVPGHDNKPLDKVKMIEFIDQRFFAFLTPFVEKWGVRVVVTADHTTSCRLKTHTAAPVPVLFYNPSSLQTHNGRFTESCASQGKLYRGPSLLDKTLLS